MNKIETGSQLKLWRKDNHLTQRELAKLTNYSTDRISKIESKDIKIPQKLIAKIEELDLLYHPVLKINPIIEKWENIEHIRNFYPNEFKVIENNIIDLLNINTNTTFDTIEYYLKFIGTSLGKIKEMTRHQYTDEETFKKEINPIASEIYRESRIYLKKKSNVSN